MDNNRALILISNDDGVNAKGINELIRYLSPLGDIIVVAPDAPRSGAGCSLTVTTPIHYSLVRRDVGVQIYKCSGTPTDCIKLAFDTILDRKPDLVVGGINHGDNSSVNVHYSGTMGIVIEGCLAGVPSIGFSLCSHSFNADFEPCAPYIQRIAREVLKNGLPKSTCLNVNFPVTKEIKGVKVCEQTKGHWQQEFVACPHPHSENYFWLSGSFVNEDLDNERNDHWALNHDYAAITPTNVDVTNYSMIDEINSWSLDD